MAAFEYRLNRARVPTELSLSRVPADSLAITISGAAMSSKDGLRFRLPTDCIPQLRNALAPYLSFLPLSTAFQIRLAGGRDHLVTFPNDRPGSLANLCACYFHLRTPKPSLTELTGSKA